MRAAFEEAEDEFETEPAYQPDRELTLSSTTLLVLFFGLVLICGLCFAFGYTLGRRTPTEASVTPAIAAPAVAPLASDSRSKPSAAQSGSVPLASQSAAPRTQAAADNSANQDDSSTAAPVTRTPPRAIPDSAPIAPPAFKLASVKPALTPALASPVSAPVTASGGVLVQIAAVSNPADADVLLSALRKRGYTVNVRHEPNDALMHVQIGPFANRADAVAMRQKLLSDGYNAILK